MWQLSNIKKIFFSNDFTCLCCCCCCSFYLTQTSFYHSTFCFSHFVSSIVRIAVYVYTFKDIIRLFYWLWTMRIYFFFFSFSVCNFEVMFAIWIMCKCFGLFLYAVHIFHWKVSYKMCFFLLSLYLLYFYISNEFL